MRLEHALQTIAHWGGLLQQKNTGMADKKIGCSNFIGPNQ
jgi:hypothetical protein